MNHKLSRRVFLKFSALIPAAALMTACNPAQPGTPAPEPTAGKKPLPTNTATVEASPTSTKTIVPTPTVAPTMTLPERIIKGGHYSFEQIKSIDDGIFDEQISKLLRWRDYWACFELVDPNTENIVIIFNPNDPNIGFPVFDDPENGQFTFPLSVDVPEKGILGTGKFRVDPLLISADNKPLNKDDKPFYLDAGRYVLASNSEHQPVRLDSNGNVQQQIDPMFGNWAHVKLEGMKPSARDEDLMGAARTLSCGKECIRTGTRLGGFYRIDNRLTGVRIKNVIESLLILDEYGTISARVHLIPQITKRVEDDKEMYLVYATVAQFSYADDPSKNIMIYGVQDWLGNVARPTDLIVRSEKFMSPTELSKLIEQYAPEIHDFAFQDGGMEEPYELGYKSWFSFSTALEKIYNLPGYHEAMEVFMRSPIFEGLYPFLTVIAM